jgi:CDP-glycerol glycerophosphotransferase (TagB/SpsB family)
MFERYVHPNSKIVSVGNPWYDTLADSADEKSDAENIDVLFIGASHTTSTKERNEKYESLVRTVINTCNKKNLNLAIKLHPNGNNDWYRERDWGKYIKEFETIDNAISSSKVLITNTSSTFVESTVLGKPIIVADVYDKQLSNLGPLKNVVFSDGVEEIPELVTDIITGDADIISMLKKGPIPVDLGQSTNQITEYVSNIKTE